MTATTNQPMHCMLQVTGPDRKGLKSRYNAFHTFRNGRATLSCSALLVLPTQSGQAGHTTTVAGSTAAGSAVHTAIVLAPVTCLYPFIQSFRRHKISGASVDDLIPSVETTVLINPSVLADPHRNSRHPSSNSTQHARAPTIARAPAKLITVLQLAAVHAAAEQLLLSTNAAAAAGNWKFGWCLADQQPLAAATPAILGHVAVLTVDMGPVPQTASAQASPSPPLLLFHSAGEWGAKASQHGRQSAASSCCSNKSSNGSRVNSTGSTASSSTAQGCTGVHQGQPVTVTGSPFGCLAEQQFFGAVVSGCVSLLLPTAGPAAAAAAEAPLFLVDGRCMPGMEGGAIHCRSCGALIGVLGVPLSNCSSQAELLLGVSTPHIIAALTTAAAAAGGEAGSAQLQSVAAALQTASCCCCSRPSGRSNSRGGTAGSAAGSNSTSCLQVHPAAAHDMLWQQPAQLVTKQHPKPQQQQQQVRTQLDSHELRTQTDSPAQQQQQQPRPASSSGGSCCNQQAAGPADPARRLQVHLQHLAPAAAAANPNHQQKAPQQASPTPTQTPANVSAGTTSSGSSSGKTGWPGLPPSALSGVVMVRVGTSWGSGVLITQSGLVLTVAHLFRKTGSRQAATAATAAAVGAAGAAGHPGLPAPQQQQAASNLHMHSSSSSSSSSNNSSSSSSGVLGVVQQDANSRRPGQQRLYPIPPQHMQHPSEPEVSIRLTLPCAMPAPSSSSCSHTAVGSTAALGGGFSSSSRNLWVPAKVLYCFTGYLDLAVLQIQPDKLKGILAPSLLKPLQLVSSKCDVTPGDEVCVIGHGLFGPRMGLDPALTAGCVAKVVAVPLPTTSSSSRGQKLQQQQQQQQQQLFVQQQQQQQQQQWKPSMVISTAAVHSGASGGALVDAAGRLVGLVTSNARHVKGQTLPHLNFCISAAELRPVHDWAQQQQQQQQQQLLVHKKQQGHGVLLQEDNWEQRGGGLLNDGRPVQQQRQELAMLDVHSVAGSKLWALQPYMHATAAAAAPSRASKGLMSSL